MDKDPQLTEAYLKKHLQTMAEKHPALIVRQLARSLMETRQKLNSQNALVQTLTVGYSLKEALKHQLKKEASE